MIRVKNIVKAFDSLTVLKGIDLEVNEGEIVSIVGPSGAGKTTLLLIMGTLSRPDSGQVWIRGNETGKLDDRRLAGFRNKRWLLSFSFTTFLSGNSPPW